MDDQRAFEVAKPSKWPQPAIRQCTIGRKGSKGSKEKKEKQLETTALRTAPGAPEEQDTPWDCPGKIPAQEKQKLSVAEIKLQNHKKNFAL